MALTKAQAALLTQDLMLKGVIETVVKESALLKYLPFDEIVGTALTYNRELTLPASAWYDVGDTWTEAAPTWEQLTAALKVVGGDAEVDAFLQKTYANPNDLAAAIIESKAKSIAHEFSTVFFDGDTAGTPKAFDGLYKTLNATAQDKDMGTNGGVLTLDLWDEFIDLVKPGKPDAIFVSKRTRRKLKSLRRASGVVMESTVGQFGEQIDTYDGIPVEIDDFILDTYTQGSSSVSSRAYALQFGLGRGVHGFENGGIQVEDIGPLETKNASKHRVKWYVVAVLMRLQGAAMMSGIIP